MKIVQLNKLYPPYVGGIEQVAQCVAEGLDSLERFDIEVVVCNEKPTTEKEIINGIQVHRSGSFHMLGNMPLSIRYLFDVKDKLKDADVVISHMPSPLSDLAIRLSGFQGKVILWWHSDIVRQKKLLKLYKPLMHWILGRADYIVTATEGHVKGSDYLGRYIEKCRVIPYCINPSIYADSTNRVRSRVEDKVVFLFVGRLVYYKGCEVLIRAYSQMVESNPILKRNTELHIIGSGPLEEELILLVQQLKLSNNVHFIGKVNDDELMDAYSNCSVLVLPSVEKSEAFGLVQIEAMAYKKPVINTDLDSGVPYVGIDNVTGFTVKVGDVGALSNAMQELAVNSELRIQMGIAGRARVEQIYTEKAMIEQLLELIK